MLNNKKLINDFAMSVHFQIVIFETQGYGNRRDANCLNDLTYPLPTANPIGFAGQFFDIL